ncbi:YoaK family protein [Streptomyces sp. NPDC102467]|uniref:YoaK family protein n=1 Tax=Streptomyces sp. NPDC102467 TaxID=3366179 RepID=UPI0037F2EC33
MNRRAQISLLLLAAASGCVDALAFTVLGTVFAGVMTGNLVLLGVAVGHLGHGPGTGEGMSAPLYALGGYVVGAALVAFVCRGVARRPEWPGRVVACLAAQAVLLAGVAVVAAVFDGHPGAAWRTVLLVVAAVSMGGQSAAMVAAGSGAAPTTYFTGTLTTLVTGIADGSPRGAGQLWVAARLLAVVGGAACAVAVHTGAPAWGFVPPAVLTAAAVACQEPAQRLRRAVTPVHKNPLHGTDNETN